MLTNGQGKELFHSFCFGFELRSKRRVPRPFSSESDIKVKVATEQSDIHPANHPVTPQQGQRIVSADAFRGRSVGLESICPSPELFEPNTIPNHRVERREKPNGLRLDIRHFARWPEIAHALDGFLM